MGHPRNILLLAKRRDVGLRRFFGSRGAVRVNMNFGEALARFYECAKDIDIANLHDPVILSGVSGLARESTHGVERPRGCLCLCGPRRGICIVESARRGWCRELLVRSLLVLAGTGSLDFARDDRVGVEAGTSGMRGSSRRKY